MGPTHRSSTLRVILPVLGFAVLFGWLWAYTPMRGGYLASSDLYEEYLPTFLAPLTWWSSYEFGGAPAFASPSESTWYPPHLLFRDLLHSLPAYVASANVIAALGAYLSLFTVTRSRRAALLAGLAFGLSEAMMERVSHLATMHTVAWFPWVIWSIDRLRVRPCWRAVPIAAATVAMFFLAGGPQTFLYGAYAALIYALVGALAERASWRFYAAGGLAVALGALLTAIASVPMLELSTQTARQFMSLDQFYGGALSGSQMLAFVFPTIQHDGRGQPTYVGLVTLVLACCALARLRSDWRVGCWLGLAIAVILVCAGELTPVARLAYELPFYDRFRIGSRHLFIVSFALAALAGLGVAHLERLRPGPRTLGLVALVPALLGLGAWAMTRWPSAFAFDDDRPLACCPVLDGLVWLQIGIGVLAVGLVLLFAAAPRSRLRLAMMAVLLVADLVSSIRERVTPYGLEQAMVPKEAARAPSVHAARLAAGLRGQQQRALAPTGTQLDAVIPAAFARVWGIPIAGGYNSMMLANYHELSQMGNNGSVEPAMVAHQDLALDVMATKYLVVHEEDLGVRDTVDVREATWARDGLDIVVGPDACQRADGATARLGLPRDRAVRAIAIVAHMACAEDAPQGSDVAVVQVTSADGLDHRRVLRAGVDIADERLEEPSQQGRAKHGQADVFMPAAGPLTYVVTIELPRPTAGAQLAVTTLSGAGKLVVDKVTALDATGVSWPQSRWSLFLSNTARWSETIRFATSRSTDRERDVDGPNEERYIVYENRRAHPRAWMVREVLTASQPDIARAFRSSVLPNGRRFDPVETALLTSAEGEPRAYPAGARTVHVRSIQDGLVRLDVSSAEPGFLVLSENAYPGWEATVDEHPAPILRVNLAHMGVEVPAGLHLVTFRFRPQSFRVGASVTGVAGVLTVALAVAGRRSRNEG